MDNKSEPQKRIRLTWAQAEERCCQIFSYYAAGLQSPAISERMNISQHLIRYYRQARCKAAYRAGVRA